MAGLETVYGPGRFRCQGGGTRSCHLNRQLDRARGRGIGIAGVGIAFLCAGMALDDGAR